MLPAVRGDGVAVGAAGDIIILALGVLAARQGTGGIRAGPLTDFAPVDPAAEAFITRAVIHLGDLLGPGAGGFLRFEIAQGPGVVALEFAEAGVFKGPDLRPVFNHHVSGHQQVLQGNAAWGVFGDDHQFMGVLLVDFGFRGVVLLQAEGFLEVEGDGEFPGHGEDGLAVLGRGLAGVEREQGEGGAGEGKQGGFHGEWNEDGGTSGGISGERSSAGW